VAGVHRMRSIVERERDPVLASRHHPVATACEKRAAAVVGDRATEQDRIVLINPAASVAPVGVDPDEAGRSSVAANRRFYTALWSATTIVPPERFNTWPLVCRLAEGAAARLEVGPGLRPRLPVGGTYFVDVSREALAPLRARGGLPVQCEITALPFPNRFFDLVGAFDVVEHVDDDRQIFRELRRVTRAGATVVFSVPLDPRRWSAFGELVGHVRRYEPAELLGILRAHDLVIEWSAPFGMEPRSRWLLRLAAWGLRHRRDRAMKWYHAVLMPLGLRLQRPLDLGPGMMDAANVGEVLLVCRRAGRTGAAR
jgi:SAM-dependent methyltransferase